MKTQTDLPALTVSYRASEPKHGQAAPRLSIQGAMTLCHATELKGALLDAVADHRTLEVDLQGVSELDSAGVQLLMLAKASAEALTGELRLTGHSAAVLQVFELLDLAAHFGDPLPLAA